MVARAVAVLQGNYRNLEATRRALGLPARQFARTFKDGCACSIPAQAGQSTDGFEGTSELRKVRRRSQMHPDNPASSFGQRFVITEGLRVLEYAE